MELKKSNAGYRVELSLVMKEVPTFIKYIKEFFHEVRAKGKEGGRVYTRCLILHDLPIEDLQTIHEISSSHVSNNRNYRMVY